MLALLAAGPLGGCTTARERDEPTNIVGNLRFRDSETARYFAHNYRSGNLYQDFRPVMVVDTIFEDERYRAHFLETLRDRYLLASNDVEEMRADQEEQFQTYFEFLVLLYGGSNEPVRLNAADANWKLLLRDDEGDLLRPVSMTVIKPDSPTYRYIQGYFAGLDRWSRMYLVRFPKLEKPLIGQPIGPHPFEMLVTGLEGTITMRWTDTAMFYRSPDGLRLPGPSPQEPPAPGAPRQAAADAQENPQR